MGTGFVTVKLDIKKVVTAKTLLLQNAMFSKYATGNVFYTSAPYFNL